ncbi:hypothetical protein ACFWPX_29955 [Nocardia sp. NPDC058518]|uniref:hypothetical protein n=1 Tax=Nocardia sp. NPDC058518 TaxID=3346534 RepID=UPI003649FC74
MEENLLAAMELPPADVVEPLLTLAGWVMWLVFGALVGAAIKSGIEVAIAFNRGEGLDVAIQKPMTIAICAAFGSSLSGWAAFLLV